MKNAPAPCFGIGLTQAQAGLVMEALGERPFRLVFALIGRLNAWANQAFGEDASLAAPAARAPFALSAAELALILQALGELPHRRVHTLIASLQVQAERACEHAIHG